MYTKIENPIIAKIYFPNYFCSNASMQHNQENKIYKINNLAHVKKSFKILARSQNKYYIKSKPITLLTCPTFIIVYNNFY